VSHESALTKLKSKDMLPKVSFLLGIQNRNFY